MLVLELLLLCDFPHLGESVLAYVVCKDLVCMMLLLFVCWLFQLKEHEGL